MWIVIVCLVIVIIFVVIVFLRQWEGLEISPTSDEKSHFLSKFYMGHFGRSPDSVILSYYEKKTFTQMRKDAISYQKRVHSGKKVVYKKSVILTGLLRNGENVIPSLKSFYKEWKKTCPQTIFLIVENDSTDQTRSLLQQWDDPSVILVCETPDFCSKLSKEFKDEEKTPDWRRIRRMAELRNLYLRYIDRNDYWFYDYLIVIDLDLIGKLFWDGIFDSFYHLDKNKHLDALSCNGIMVDDNVYYDSFAYIQKNEPYEWNTRMDKRSHDDDVLKYVTEKYRNNMDLDHVVSAFGGFCIYRMSSIRKKKARYGFSHGKYSCEHTHFNRTFPKFMVNPRMIFLIERNVT